MSPPDPLLGEVLKGVSRSFYLSLAILPRSVREPIGLAYLLARASDTVADTRLVPRDQRIAHLESLRRAYRGEPADLGAIGRACAPLQSHGAERILLERVGEAVARVEALPTGDRARVRTVLDTITSGQLFDLTRFRGEDAARLAALDTVEELDRYTFQVAGCVGEFWTAVHLAHRPRLSGWDPLLARRRGVRFGKALQLTNVLRDVPADLRAGRCYLPARDLAALGLAPADLLTSGGARRARPLVRQLIAVALEHYDAAWQYTLDIPRAEFRMRLACAWPLLIGLTTLAALARHPDPVGTPAPVKISRAAVRGILARSAVTVWSNAALARDAARLRARAVPDLEAARVSLGAR
ncbi:MAG: squalene/phytoene synthase family protein [Candidatus Rokubacteria bacterium]|nr:squalene/phytoene synthase family protein [Candidatus Rokubacteria bacterium]